MRRVALCVVMAGLLALIPVTCWVAPGLVDRAAPAPHDPEAPRRLRSIAGRVVARYEALYGHLPLEDWPEQPRASYGAALRCLEALGSGD